MNPDIEKVERKNLSGRGVYRFLIVVILVVYLVLACVTYLGIQSVVIETWLCLLVTTVVMLLIALCIWLALRRRVV